MKVPTRVPVDASVPIPSRRFSKLRIIKNAVVLGIGVHLLFFAYDGLTMLQSTMNREQGIGVISQAVIYVCFCISAVLFPKYIIKKLGSKSTFAFSMLTYLPYVASNFYSHWALMIPTSILIGLGAALLWGSQAIYLNDISLMYAELTLKEREGSARQSQKGKSKRSLSLDSNYFSNVISQPYKNTDTKCYSISATETPLSETSYDAIGGGVPENEHKNNYGSFENAINFSKNTAAKCYSIPMTETPHTDNSYTTGGFFENEQTNNYIPFDNTVNLSKNEKNAEQQQEADYQSRVTESTTARFFGFHGVAYLSSHITSNLMTYYILQTEVPAGIQSNSSCICGADYCNVESSCFEENLAEPSNQMRYILTAVCVCVGVISALVVFLFLDPIETEKEEVSFSTDLLMATYKLAKTKKLILLVPFSCYVGMVQGFFTGDFNKSFVGCAWGAYHVGLVAVCYGAVCGLSSFSSGWLVRRLGRIPIFVAATLVNLGANGFLLSWSPSAQEPRWFFVGAGLWGVFVGAIWSQLRAFYGVLFKADEEAAFAAFHVWYSLGFAMSFGYSNYICTSVKIYILITTCILGFAGYLCVERMHLKNKAEK